MKIEYQLFVHGVPKGQPRHRKAASGHMYNPGTADAWREEIIAAFLLCRRPMLTGAVHLKVNFFMPIPKNLKLTEGSQVPHIKKPDSDNLLKTIMDAMTQAKVWKDDALVFWSDASKWYAVGKLGAQIIVETGF